jgi:hypothetical protein
MQHAHGFCVMWADEQELNFGISIKQYIFIQADVQ